VNAPALAPSQELVRVELATENESSRQLFEEVQALTIASEEDCENVTDFIRQIKAQNKALEERKQSVTKPLLKVVEEIRGWFRPAQEWLTKAEGTLKGKLSAYRTEVDQKNQEALRLLAEAAEAKNLAGVAAATQGFVQQPQVKGLTMTGTWGWHLVDADLVPREFLSVDPAKITAHIKAAGKSTPASIPGIEFERNTRVTVR
jgi:hypothetical protein